MASSVLSLLLQSREHAWMWEKVVCVCVCLCFGFVCVNGAEDKGKKSTEEMTLTSVSMSYCNNGAVNPSSANWSTQVKRILCVLHVCPSTCLHWRIETQTVQLRSGSKWPLLDPSLSVHKQPDLTLTPTPLHSHTQTHTDQCLLALLTSWSPSHSPAGLSFTPWPLDHPRQHPERHRGRCFRWKATVIFLSVGVNNPFPKSGQLMNH